jgi:quercetin dioxygenase-like cupin family protein
VNSIPPSKFKTSIKGSGEVEPSVLSLEKARKNSPGKGTDRGPVIEKVYKREKDITWKSHPLNERLKMRFLITKQEDQVDVTCVTGRIPKGEVVPEHAHDVHDLIYPLAGSGKIWVAGIGSLELKRGVLIHIPPGVRHKIYDVNEDLELFDVFSGPVL